MTNYIKIQIKKKKKTVKGLKIPIAPVSPFDPLGSYTGNFLTEPLEEPTQDVDDL